MKTRLFALIMCFLSIRNLVAQEELWESTKGDFSVHMVISATRIPIDRLLTVQFILKYPNTHTPDIKTFRKHFLTHTGMGISPFALVKQEIKKLAETSPGLMSMEIAFSLSPQALGEFALMFQAMPFLDKNAKKDDVKIPLGLFEVEIIGAPKDLPLETLIEPPLNSTKDFPVEISQKNKYEYILAADLSENELLRSVKILRSKTFPWVPFFAVLAFMFAYLIVKMSPHNVRKPLGNAAETKWKDALLQLKSLLAATQEKKMYQANLIKLDHAIRSYIEGKYQIAASTSTSQEFLQMVSKSHSIDMGMRTQLVQFLSAADKVKYAHYILSDQEYVGVLNLAKEIMERN